MSMWLGKKGNTAQVLSEGSQSSEFGHMTANELSHSKIQGPRISFLSLSPNLQVCSVQRNCTLLFV